MDLQIVRLDPDEVSPRFDSAVALAARLLAEVDPGMDADSDAYFRAHLRGSDTFERHNLMALVEAEAVGLARMWTARIEGNTDKAEAQIEVDPAHRRQGIGSALLRACVDICDQRDRTNLIGVGVVTDETDGFWASFGAELRLVERVSRLWLERTSPELMQQWIDGRLERAGDYELVHWRGETAPELRATVSELTTAMNDAPLDELDWSDDIWTDENVVEYEEYLAATGAERWVSVAMAPDGTPAGYTTVHVEADKPRFGQQGDTVVLDAHRNRGIGRWLKADMWQRLREHAPEMIAIDTDNAESNDAMLAINVAMGFEPLMRLGYWQTDVSTVRPRLPRPAGAAPTRQR